MIKASQFSLQANLFGDLSKHSPPSEHSKEHLSFLAGDPTAYGHHIKMQNAGYEIIKKSIRCSKNHSYAASNGSVVARQAVAKHFGGSDKITANDVILTHGANMGLFTALMSITNPGDNILVPDIGYPFFNKTGPSVGVEARQYKLDASKRFEIDLAHLSTLIDERTRFLWIVNPSNPCGSVFSKHHMEEILQFCREKHLFIISDEVYWNESFSEHEFTSFGHIESDVPVIVIGGLEKTFMVPGWSLSWMIFFDPFQKLSQIKQGCLTSCQLFLHPCSFLMAALPELLDTLTADYTKNYMDLFEENHKYLFDQISQIKGLKPIQAQGTFYLSVLIDLPAFKQFSSDVQFLDALLQEENISVLNLSVFSNNFQGFRLMTCGTMPLYEKLIPRLQEFCARHIKE